MQKQTLMCKYYLENKQKNTEASCVRLEAREPTHVSHIGLSLLVVEVYNVGFVQVEE